MTFRIEEKIALTPYECTRWQAELTRRGMVALYPTRRIHSTYFETPDLQMYRDSEEGVLPRKKIRLRHYPDQPERGSALEIKVSSIEGRYKTVEHPDDTEAGNLMRFGYLDNQYGPVLPRLQVTYERQYLTLQGLRITFDSHIRYASPGTGESFEEPWQVCELKALDTASLDDILKIAEAPRRRFSKFCNAAAILLDRRAPALSGLGQSQYQGLF